MPITGQGFEVHIVRDAVQSGSVGAVTRRRTVGRYAVFINGVRQPGLDGWTAEPRGPGDNTRHGADHDLRIRPGRYPLWTQGGTKYKTIGYRDTPAARAEFVHRPRPGIELMQTGTRTEILIHPATGFSQTEGCINLSGPLPDGGARINHQADSRPRVVALIAALRAFAGAAWPGENGRRIPDAWCVLDGEP